MSTHAEQGGLFSMMGTADAQLKKPAKKPKNATQPGKGGGASSGAASKAPAKQAEKTFPKISVYYAGNTIDLPR